MLKLAMEYSRAEKTFGIFVGLTLCSVPFLVACGCATLYIYNYFIFEGISETFGSSEKVEGYTQASAEQYLAIAIPPEATDIHYAAYHIGWQDFEVFLRFSLPYELVDEFLTSLAIQLPIETNKYPDSLQYGYTRAIEWWQPQQAKSYRGGEQIENQSGISILIDETDPELAAIYLHGYSY